MPAYSPPVGRWQIPRLEEVQAVQDYPARGAYGEELMIYCEKCRAVIDHSEPEHETLYLCGKCMGITKDRQLTLTGSEAQLRVLAGAVTAMRGGVYVLTANAFPSIQCFAALTEADDVLAYWDQAIKAQLPTP